MMAFERTPGTESLDPALVTELRLALTQSLQTGNHGTELKELLARAAADARAKGVHAETLLVALKDLWYSLPHLAANHGSDVQTRLLQQLIAHCIQEYYAS